MRTRVGYAGGSLADPTYYSLGDHSETIQIDYDPDQISYEQLLAVFWDSHSPYARSWSTQYASKIFYHDEKQREQAEASLRREEATTGRKIYTELAPFDRFYLAEDYHQKYYLRYEGDLVAELQAIYPQTRDFINSTAVARLNGFAGQWISEEQLEALLPQLGLSEEMGEKLLAEARRQTASCPLPALE
ncbi:MAG: peptide-methionine (S)-S-oxide reductase [Anaerolineae bacterium]|nr:peptide-methionine (S)-S-oxide reductase [Anaerolineae bacterium]